MKRSLLLIISFFFFLIHRGQTVYNNYSDGQLYVKLKSQAARQILAEDPRNIPLNKTGELREILSLYNVTRITRPFFTAGDDDILPYVLRLEFGNASQISEMTDALLRLKAVEYAEKVPLMRTDATPSEGIPTHLSQVNAANAWNVFNGNSNITVAIIDNAVMWTHADLVQNTFTNTAEIAGNNIDDDNNGYVDDVNGFDVSDWDNNTIPSNLSMDHGTHCAGTAAGRTDNNTGIASIGWNIKFIPVKCQTNGGSTSIVANGYEGIIYAAKLKARVISCSWGGTGSSFTEQAAVNYAWNKGCIIMASAGNDNWSTPNYPGAYNNVYCVAAVNTSNLKSSYSNFGTWVDICAPGDAILSTVPYTSTPAYQQMSGTSMATPLVAGLAGLMLSKSPHMTRTDVLNCISGTAVNIYSLSGNSSFATGSQLGIGRIEAFQAMNCAATFSAMPPVANFYAFPLHTCPNTPVQFFDSSLYAPTSYAWVFQGGTPATSTLANPVVQWNSTGTYSVQLTVSNAQGNSSKTKLSYITVAGPQSLPFAEGFENSQFLPSGWTPNNIGMDAMYWERKTGVGGFGTSTASAMFDNYNYFAANERDEMRSPKLDLSTAANVSLKFDVAYARFNSSFSDTLEVRVSTDCGQSWTSIYNKGGTNLSTAPDQGNLFVPSNTQWRTESVSISSLTAGQPNVMFSFINRGHYGQPIYLDNINLSFPNPSLTIISQSAHCVGIPFSFSATALAAANYTWTFPGGSPSSTTGLTHTVLFNSPGLYQPTLTVVNGTYNANIALTVQINAFPTVTVNQPTICSGNAATLTAGGATDYVWTSGSGTLGSTSTITVSPQASTIFTVTGSNGFANGGCASQSTAAVIVHPTPTVTATSSTICPGGTATISASGASSYSWTGGSAAPSFTAAPSANTVYIVTGTSNNCTATANASVTVAPAVTPTVAATSTLVCPGDPITLSASGAATYTWFNNTNGSQVTVNPTGTTIYSLTGSNGVCTGTAQLTASVVPPPVINITASGSTTFCAGNTLTLTSSGGNSYTWTAGPLTASMAVTPASSSIYTVTGAGQACSRTATIALTVVPSTVNLTISANTPTICESASLSLHVSGANNYTWSTGSNSSSLSISPFASGYIWVKGESAGCMDKDSLYVTIIPLPVTMVSFSNQSCSTGCDGSIGIMSTQGSGPFTYSLLNTSCTQTLCPNLCAGIYSLQTSGTHNCSSITTVTIAAPPQLTTATTFSNSTCPACTDGAASVTGQGGTAPYSYSWIPAGVSGSLLAGVSAGCYTVIISDANNCTEDSEVCIGSFTGLENNKPLTGWRIFPNPATSEIFIETGGLQLNYGLYSHLGQLLRVGSISDEVTRLSLSDLARGVYYLEIESGGEKRRHKIVLQ